MELQQVTWQQGAIHNKIRQLTAKIIAFRYRPFSRMKKLLHLKVITVTKTPHFYRFLRRIIHYVAARIRYRIRMFILTNTRASVGTISQGQEPVYPLCGAAIPWVFNNKCRACRVKSNCRSQTSSRLMNKTWSSRILQICNQEEHRCS